MKVKKYTAKTEQDAIEMVKNELGPTALVLNIKKIQPKGWTAVFRKTTVEVTAAYEDPEAAQNKIAMPQLLPEDNKSPVDEAININADKQKLITQQMRIGALEQELLNKETLLEKATGLLSAAAYKNISGHQRRYENNMIQIFYDALTGQGVTDEIAEFLLRDVARLTDPAELPIAVKVVYNNIIEILGRPQNEYEKPRGVYFFLGPTGVGKTTTIAKLSSRFVFNDNVKVGLITADTYRIAAVEQLKTYAEILGIDIGIVYNAADLADLLPKMESFSDVVIIDTAGRSHQNAEAVKDLRELIQTRPEARKYLVLSLTTKTDDLLSIINAYSNLADFDIIFTKADETLYLGSVLNISRMTGKKISYIAYGQSVPDDISVIRPEQIARSLLGLGGTSLW